METYCTRPDCSQPINNFPDLDDRSQLQTVQQKYCNNCGMPQILAGRYIPQRILGRGGFGAAYLAIDRYSTKLRQCVVKQFQPSDNLNEKTLKIAENLFTREAEVLETLGNEHPQIPNLYAFFPLMLGEEGQEEKQFFYIVQEFIEGETLEQEVQRKGKLNEREIIEVLENMLNVLKFVHEHNSIHRDIKPSNIIRSLEGKLYLLDFGAVKRVTGASTANYSTGIYSMGFAPLEQMQGRKVYPSTDLYALAATCLRLATGRPIQELYDSYNNEWSWRNYADLGEGLGKILDRMLFSTPKQRFPSAQAVLNALGDSNVSEQLKELPRQETPPEAVFSQPADWRSLLAISKEESESNSPTSEAKQTDWQSLLSLSETEDEEEDSTALQNNQPVPSPPTQTQDEEENSTALQQKNQPVPSPPTPAQDDYKPVSTPKQQSRESLVPRQETPPPEYPKPSRQTPRFALWELLASAGFTGLEGALLLIAFTSLFPAPAISIGLWGMSMGGIIYSVWKRFIEKVDFAILGVITLAVVVLVPPLHSVHGITIGMVIITSIVASAGTVAFVALFRLIYNLISR